MSDYSLPSFMIPAQSNGPATPNSLAMKRKLAESLLQSGMDTSPIGSPWQAAARIAQAIAGGSAMNSANQQELAARKSVGDQMNSPNPDYGALMAGGWVDPQTAMQMPTFQHNNAMYGAQDKFANGDNSQFARAFPQQAAELYSKQQIMNMNGNSFDQAVGQGQGQQGQQTQAAPMPQPQGQMAPQAAPAPAQGMPNTPANTSPPLATIEGQLDANGFPTRPVTDSSKIQVPASIMAQARNAAMMGGPMEGHKVIAEYQKQEADRLNGLYEKGSSYSHIAAQNSGDSELEKAKATGAASVINGREAAVKRMQTLEQLANLWDQNKGNIATGPFASNLLKMKEGLRGAGFDVGDSTAPSEIISKLGLQLASEDAKSLTSRPTQAELKMYLANNPGLTMTPEGNMAMIRMKRQLAQRDIDLADAMMNKSYRDLPQVMSDYDASHHLLSPLTGKPLDPTALEYPAANGAKSASATPQSNMTYQTPMDQKAALKKKWNLD
jgi:hypothetical protein